ncbi:MAG TPA: acyltransferase [Acidobacteriaceae bacterium]|nr:acyltransferase [Acidobacteriaceae bacterium]
MLPAPASSLSSESSQAEPNHIAALDGMRGLAVLLVVAFHVFGVNDIGSRPLELVLHKLMAGGWLGVDIFFVLSGFLITGILYNTLSSDRFFKNFYGRRALRIFPLYYGYLILVVASHYLLGTELDRRVVFLFTYTQNIFGDHWDILSSLTGHLWSLAVEEQFYLFWPLIIFSLRDRLKIMRLCIILSVVALTLRITLFALLPRSQALMLCYRLVVCRMDSLLIGGWLALALQGPTRRSLARYSKVAFGGFSSIILMIAIRKDYFWWWNSRITETFGFTVIALASAALLMMALSEGSYVQIAFKTRILRWFGRYSYGIYIYHFGTQQLFQRWVLPTRLARSLISNPGRLVVFSATGSFAITIALAWLSYNFYEIHFLKLKRYFSYNRPPRQPVIQFSTPTNVEWRSEG